MVKQAAWFAVFALVFLAGGFLALAGNSPSFDSRDAVRKQYFPDVVLTTQDGKQVHFYEDLLKDKIVTINFMYTDCPEGVCPITTHNLLQARKILAKRGPDRLGHDIFTYSISLDPKHDTPEVLKRYAKEHGAEGPGWLFLTGKPEDVELLRRKLGFTDTDPAIDKEKTSHVGAVRYGNERYQWWSMVPGASKPDVIAESVLYVDWPKPSAKTN
jgi:protein SCO1/2